MSFDLGTSVEVVATALGTLQDASGALIFGQRVLIGHYPPKRQLPSGLCAYVSGVSARVAETTLVSTIEVHTVRVGIYRGQAEAAQETDAKALWAAVPVVMDVFKGDFTLGGGIRNIDWGGQYGTPPLAEYEEEEIADRPYWTAHLFLPLVVDPTAVFVA